jgi:hypothetical protein
LAMRGPFMDGFVLDTAVAFILAIVTVFVGAALGTAAYRAYEAIRRRGARRRHSQRW